MSKKVRRGEKGEDELAREHELEVLKILDQSPYKIQIRQLEERIEQLKREKESIVDVKKVEDKTHEVAIVGVYREVDKLKLKCETLETELRLTKELDSRKLEESEVTWRAKYEDFEKRVAWEREEARTKEISLENQLKVLEKFVGEKDDLYKSLEDMSKRIVELEREIQQTKNKAYLELMTRVEQMEKQRELEIEDIKKQAKTKAEEDVRARGDFLRLENVRLTQIVNQQAKELDHLRNAKKQFAENTKNMKLDFELTEEGVLEYQQIHVKLTEKIKTLKEKIEMMKAALADEASNHTHEMETLKATHIENVKNLEGEVIRLRSTNQRKMREVRELKAVSQMILDQRSDIETFFLEALAEVREEILAKQKSKANRLGGGLIGGSLKLPSLSVAKSVDHLPTKLGDTPMSQKTKEPKDRIDFKDLDWDDREKLLRILFSKINKGQKAIPWRASNDESMVTSSVKQKPALDSVIKNSRYERSNSEQRKIPGYKNNQSEYTLITNEETLVAMSRNQGHPESMVVSPIPNKTPEP